VAKVEPAAKVGNRKEENSFLVGMRLEEGIGRHGCRWVGCVCMERMDMDAGDTSRCSRTTNGELWPRLIWVRGIQRCNQN